MKICNEVSIGLKRLANSTLVPNDKFESLLHHLAEFFSNIRSRHCVDIPNSTAKVEVFKESYAALLCFLVECVRKKESIDVITTFLESSKFTPDRIQKILSVYSGQQDKIYKALSYYGCRPYHIYNASWKLNFCVKTSFSDLEGKVIYYITLHIGHHSVFGKENKLKTLTFVCTVQHLQEFVSKLRAASRSLESIAAYSR